MKPGGLVSLRTSLATAIPTRKHPQSCTCWSKAFKLEQCQISQLSYGQWPYRTPKERQIKKWLFSTSSWKRRSHIGNLEKQLQNENVHKLLHAGWQANSAYLFIHLLIIFTEDSTVCSDSLQNTHKDKLHYHRSSVYKDVIILGEEEVTTILNYLRNLKQVLLL